VSVSFFLLPEFQAFHHMSRLRMGSKGHEIVAMASCAAASSGGDFEVLSVLRRPFICPV